MTSSTPTPRPFLTLHTFSDAVWERLEDRLGEFEAAWQRDERPDLAHYLDGVSGEERDTLLVELVHEDLEYRLGAGEAARVEDYLRRFPELGRRDDTLVDLLAMECLLREAAGTAPTAEEHRQRFPQHADALAARIDTLRIQAGVARTVRARGEPSTQTATLAPTGGAIPSGTTDPAGQSTQLPDGAPTLPPAVPGAAMVPGTGSIEPGGMDGDSSVPRISVPGYEVLGLLGRGGMGIVLLARQLSLGRLVALKIIRDAVCAGEAERRRFRAEAEAIACLQHPNVIHIYDVGEYEGLLHMALEYCPGGSLAGKLQGKPMPAVEAAGLVEALARGIHAAHLKGVIHRDLKPANVLVAEDGTPKITDFGLVKRLDTPGQTSLGVVVGTPNYMAPEQAGGRTLEIGPAVDVYALGAVLYELITGRPPFQAGTTIDTVLQVLSKEPTPPSQLNSAIPSALEAICLRCLQKGPQDRYGSALELAEALRQFQQGQAASALPMAQPLTETMTAKKRRVKAGLTVGSLPGGGYGCAIGLTVGMLLVAVTGGLLMTMLKRPGDQYAQVPPLPLSTLRGPDLIAPLQTRALLSPPPSKGLPGSTRRETVRVKAIDVKHIAREGMRATDIGLMGKQSFVTRLGDSVEVKARLSRPAYAYLIAFRPDGEEDLCFPEKADKAPPLTDTPRYPLPDESVEYGLDEGVGLAVFAVVASSHPLPPYREWKARHGAIAWGKHEPQPGVVLWYDGDSVDRWTEDDSAVSRAKREAADKGPLLRLAQSLRGGEVESVAAIGFAVLPKGRR
jgi:hypothetical protein